MSLNGEAIIVENVKKEYEYYAKGEGLKGSIKNFFHREILVKKAVNDISFRIHEGEMVGLLGPNGAGKTTTLKMLAGILYPTSGTIYVDGFIPWERKNEYRKKFAIVMGQKNQLWWDLPAVDTFEMNRRIYQIEKSVYQKTLDELSEMLGVSDLLHVQVRRLSLGERMKMEIIAALLHKPKILYLDEPTIGLDILSQRSIREFLKSYNEQTKTTVILTSHYTMDIEAVCPRTIIINKGEVVFDGALHEVGDVFGKKKILNIKSQRDMERQYLESLGTIREMEKNTASLEVERDEVEHCLQKLMHDMQILDINIMDIPIEEGIAYFNEKS